MTLEQAKTHLQILDVDHDADIEMKVLQASAIVLDYCKFTTVPAEWLSGSPAIVSAPPLIQAYTLGIVSELFYNRESSVFNIAEIRKLIPRDPTMA